MKMASTKWVLGLALPIASACGGPEPHVAPSPASSASADPTTTAPSATPPASDATTTPPPAKAAWKDMNHGERAEFMAKVVMPKMQEEFAAFDAKRYAKITCATCHGSGAKDSSFKMPNGELPKLHAEGGFKKHMDKTPEATKFMMAKVVPEMAKLLGEPTYDPKTQRGFGCMECHQMAK
jgi:hypothetical protein